jgi:hypothetical protein
MNHGVTAVRVAFAAGMDAGVAANAAAWVNEEFAVIGGRHADLPVIAAVLVDERIQAPQQP